MTAAELAGDDAARAAVVEDLDSTLFLEAGAGSGKTSCLAWISRAYVVGGVCQCAKVPVLQGIVGFVEDSTTPIGRHFAGER